MIIIADTSALIALAICDSLYFLDKLYKKVTPFLEKLEDSNLFISPELISSINTEWLSCNGN